MFNTGNTQVYVVSYARITRGYAVGRGTATCLSEQATATMHKTIKNAK